MLVPLLKGLFCLILPYNREFNIQELSCNRDVNIQELSVVGTLTFKNCPVIGASTFKNCPVIGTLTFKNRPVIGTSAFKNCPVIRTFTFKNRPVIRTAITNCPVTVNCEHFLVTLSLTINEILDPIAAPAILMQKPSGGDNAASAIYFPLNFSLQEFSPGQHHFGDNSACKKFYERTNERGVRASRIMAHCLGYVQACDRASLISISRVFVVYYDKIMSRIA